MERKHKKRVLAACLLVCAGLALYVVHDKYFHISPKDFKNWILSWGWAAPAVFIILYAFRPFVLFPSSVFAMTAGLAFGFGWGSLYTYCGSLAGGLLTYLAVSRFGTFKKAGQWEGKYSKIRENIKKEGFIYVLLLRLLPVLNYDLVSYLTSVSKVRFRDYALATAVGIIPGTLAYTYFGTSVTSGNKGAVWAGVGVLLVLVGIPILLKKRMQKKIGL
ncbi:TVP38/TMEM64 family protein [Fictibacillus iocasae]|uniref:TVP38/TMEM64 family membrane protein n=1 Tax=Fictibacillus iocasae TaxID=2715437 RepID=A0ABW2NSY3_9BACL